MATSFLFNQSRPTAFVVRRAGGKVNAGAVRLVKPVSPRCEQVRMTKAEAEVFFAACEAPIKAEINIFEHLPVVAQWFKE
ncbi:MAG: hypothetical protein M3Y54_15380 [Bacteroidota bacterium]|nr:hypothetical protein [Bacteroidota bacterium]